eukprot:273426_1
MATLEENRQQHVFNKMLPHEKDLIFGYNHIAEKEYKCVIPAGIIRLVASYYFPADIWDLSLKSKDITLSNNNQCVYHNCPYGSGQTAWRSIYGTNICTNDIYKWGLKIVKVDPNSGKGNSWNILVGICQSQICKDRLEKCFMEKCFKAEEDLNRPHPQAYGFIGSLARLTGKGSLNYGQPFKQDGDTIIMTLDMIEKTLSYEINGVDYGKAFDVEKATYRLALSISDGRCIQLF